MGDDLYPKAVALAEAEGSFRIALIQSELLIGFNRASRLVERMEDEGICTRHDSDGMHHVIQ